MIIPSALNVLIIGVSVVIFGFLWRMAAASASNSEAPWLASLGQAMAVAF